MTAIKRSAQASLVFIHSGALPPAGISQSWTATSCPAFLRVQAIQCALVRSAELKLMKNFCPMEAHYRAEFAEFRLDSIFDSEAQCRITLSIAALEAADPSPFKWSDLRYVL